MRNRPDLRQEPAGEARVFTLQKLAEPACDAGQLHRQSPPFLKRPESRGYAAKANFCFGVTDISSFACLVNDAIETSGASPGLPPHAASNVRLSRYRH